VVVDSIGFGHGSIGMCRRTWFAPSHHSAGNRRQQTFFCDEDYPSDLELMGQSCGAHKVEIWVHCLMPNHVHLIAVPQSADGLKRAIGEVHRGYTSMVNFGEMARASQAGAVRVLGTR
jgi:REP element-mobilizing transposase RayT